MDEAEAEGDKLFVKSRANLHDKRFYLGKYEYMFSQRGSRFELRKLSNTFHANVIFSLTLHGTQTPDDLEGFEAHLRGR